MELKPLPSNLGEAPRLPRYSQNVLGSPYLFITPRLIKELEQKAVDADWNGQTEAAKGLWQRANELRKKLEQGITYEIVF